mgnify:CR=1 FL=1
MSIGVWKLEWSWYPANYFNRWVLSLNGLTSLSDAAAESLSKLKADHDRVPLTSNRTQCLRVLRTVA